MAPYKKTLAFFAVTLMVLGSAQLVAALTYHRIAGRMETDEFLHQYYPMNEGIPYEQLFDKALALQQQVAGLTVAYHVTTGVAALVAGLMLLTFAFDKYVDLFGRPAPPL